eukprot:13035403-Alexandrium_andersonii.AAC.1
MAGPCVRQSSMGSAGIGWAPIRVPRGAGPLLRAPAPRGPGIQPSFECRGLMLTTKSNTRPIGASPFLRA